MPHIISLTGPSGSGKSTTIELLLKNKSIENGFNPICVPKFTTRKKRIDDKSTEVICVQTIPKTCDLVYQQYDIRYGLNSTTIINKLKEGFSPIIVLNDIRLIQEVKSIFGKLVRTVFVFRGIPSEEYFKELALSRNVIDELETSKRLKKAAAIYRIYIENIYLFDNVFLNFDIVEDLEIQVDAFSKSLQISYIEPNTFS